MKIIVKKITLPLFIILGLVLKELPIYIFNDGIYISTFKDHPDFNSTHTVLSLRAQSYIKLQKKRIVKILIETF